jgi:hypothetical protein
MDGRWAELTADGLVVRWALRLAEQMAEQTVRRKAARLVALKDVSSAEYSADLMVGKRAVTMAGRLAERWAATTAAH